MPDNPKVLVVGTTTDYIDWLRRAAPGRALYLTAPSIREKAQEPKPTPDEELLGDLTDPEGIFIALDRHLREYHITLVGVACFDCESLDLAAVLATRHNLPFPTRESIGLCRDKLLSKQTWQKSGVRSPRTRLVRSAPEAAEFFAGIAAPCVLKPVAGSGSELVFRCDTAEACASSYQLIRQGLRARHGRELYRNHDGIAAEEFIHGEEFSCDFIVLPDRVEILRLTRKLHAAPSTPEAPFGTIMGYALLLDAPTSFSVETLRTILGQGASALGCTGLICMVDFLVDPQGISLLEMTPRPGGDCLPQLIREACDIDILVLTLELAAGQPLPPRNRGREKIGLRLHSRRAGRITAIDATAISNDPRVSEVNLIKSVDSVVTMPPADYDSWYLGHAIFTPAPDINLEHQCRDLRAQLTVNYA
ncbi:MAG: ATP-grasp domain-containing protein [Proteobacteria bacterium]|nr:ATP-grasp domain-containing protein [Pseudomonadota bacterium]MBU1686082.1 ATP-grasp domain-containing protein [Pseudomonadota bacterium]